ncbi:MAG: hypothetical protein BGN88_14765 [Clostridiales bacterium 43-6]|nr:MAG: hypothetical protein BGN88_14765 [Clostridiales bacterium 43-6]
MAEYKKTGRTGRRKSAALKMEQENKELEQAVNKNHRRKKNHLKVVKVKKPSKLKPVVILLLILLVSYLFLYYNAKAPTGLVEWAQSSIALMGEGKGFPQTVSGGSLQNIYSGENQILILSETTLASYNHNGKLVYNRQHGYANPVVETSKSRTLIYDRAGKSYRIENPDRTLTSGKCDNVILAGSIGDNGTYAFINRSRGYTAEFTVYSKDFKPIYKWSSAGSQLGCISVSPTGKQVAVAAIDAESAEFKSELLIFDLSKTEPISKTVFTKEFITSVNFVDKSNISVITDKQFIRVKNDGSGKKEYSFGDSTLRKPSVQPKEGTLICLSANNDDAMNQILMFKDNGEKICDFNFNKKLISADIFHDTIYILSQNELFSYNLKGTQLKRWEVSADATKVKAQPKGVAVLFSESINILK